MIRGFIYPVVLLLLACASSHVPMLEQTRVEVATAVTGVLETDGHCYRLDMNGAKRTIVWVEGTRFGRDAAGRYVTDIGGARRYIGQRIGLSGGPLQPESVSGDTDLSRYLRDCGDNAVRGLRFTEL